MRYCFLLHPLLVFGGISTLAWINWFFTPFDMLLKWGVAYKASPVILAEIWGVTLAAFVAGSLLGIFVFQNKGRPKEIDMSLLDKSYWLSVGLSIFSFLFFVVNALAHGGLGALLDPFRSREYYVTGITTWVHFGTATVILSVLLWVDGKRSKSKLMWGAVVLATLAFRSVFGAERLALFVPILGAIIAYVVFRQLRLRVWHIVCAPFIPIMFFGAFTAMEYNRSYQARIKDGYIESGLIRYSFERIRLYYALSVNSGGILYEMVRDTGEAYPVFGGTVGPLADLSRTLHPPGIVLPGKRLLTKDVLYEMTASGYYNPEFNNKWGLVTPYLEGRLTGFFYWVLMGFVGSGLFLVATRHLDVMSVAAFGIFVAGLVDAASRVNLLAGGQVLFPLVYLLISRRFVLRVPLS